MIKQHPPLTDFQITETMMKLGGGFVSHLGRLWRLGDEVNQAKLKDTFLEYWAKYAELTVRCPECGKTDILKCHHDGKTSGVPECDFLECEDCLQQWGHN